jgi:hypothetical protein
VQFFNKLFSPYLRGCKTFPSLDYPENVLQEWFEFSDEHKNVLLRLRAWMVTDLNIVRYAKVIGMEVANSCFMTGN